MTFSYNIWVTTKEAINRVTPNLNNLYMHLDYVGNDNHVVTSSKGLSISSIGSSQYFSNGNLVSLYYFK